MIYTLLKVIGISKRYCATVEQGWRRNSAAQLPLRLARQRTLPVLSYA